MLTTFHITYWVVAPLCFKPSSCKEATDFCHIRSERTPWALLTYLLSQSQALRVGDWCQLLFLQLLNGIFLVPQIQLGAHQDDGCGGAVVANLRVPLVEGRVKGKQNQRRAGEDRKWSYVSEMRKTTGGWRETRGECWKPGGTKGWMKESAWFLELSWNKS